MFCILCPRVRDKKFSYTKASGMLVTNVSLKSQLVYRGRSVHKIGVRGGCSVFVTNRSAGGETASYSCR